MHICVLCNTIEQDQTEDQALQAIPGRLPICNLLQPVKTVLFARDVQLISLIVLFRAQGYCAFPGCLTEIQLPKRRYGISL